jgi:cob(I)alamin adenosyltransferase
MMRNRGVTMEKGYIQVYMGLGKGKTTAAFGLAMRALGRGLKVGIFQFLKNGDTGEALFLLKYAPQLTYENAGIKGFYLYMDEKGRAEALDQARTLFSHAREACLSGEYDLVVLDELLGSLENEMLPLKDVLYLLDKKAPDTEVVLTGRVVPAEIAERAGLITDMRCAKHYYEEGRKPVPGIEY